MNELCEGEGMRCVSILLTRDKFDYSRMDKFSPYTRGAGVSQC